MAKSIISSDHIYQFPTISADPTLADLPVGTQQTFLNTNTGKLEHWGNKNGSIEKISGASAAVTVDLVDAISGQYVYQLDNSADVIISSNQLARWNEKLGSGKDIIIPSSRPTYYANGQNAKPYVTGSNISLSAFPVSSSPCTMYFILRTPSIIEDVPFIHWGNVNGADGVRYSSSGTLGQFCRIYTGVSPYYSGTYYNVPRTDWMLIAIKFKDDNSFLIEVNKDLMGVGHLDQAGGGAYSFDFLNLSTYSGLQVSEFRIFSRLTSDQEDDIIKSYFTKKYNIQSNRNQGLLIFGDSHSVGIQSGSQIGTPYVNLLHTQTGVDIVSYSQSGATVESLLQGSSLLNYYQIANQEQNKDYWVLFNLGTNDAATATYGYGWQDWSRWKDDYKSYILSFINNGFDRAKIIIATPPFSTGSYVGGQLTNVKNKIIEIADELQIQLSDWYSMMIAAGLDANTVSGGDGIHVDDTCHELIASRIDYITRRVQNKYFEIAGDPTVYILGDKEQGLFKNISNNEKRLWVNDGGTMFKSAALT